MTLSISLSFRPVLPTDKSRVLAFTTYTWGEENEDYIQYVFDDWVNEPKGEFTAAVLGDEVVGISKLTDLGDGEWWLEGLRVDPAYRRQGIAAALNRFHVDLARKLGGVVIRYMTGGENAGSQAIGARAGFQHVITCAAHLAEASSEFAAPQVLTAVDAPALMRWIDSPLMHYQHGAYRISWSVRTLNEREISQTIAAGRAYGLKERHGHVRAWAALREESDDNEDDAREKRLRIDHLDGEPEAIIELARAMRGLAAGRHCAIVSAGISDYAPLVEAITQAGYHLNPDDFQLWVLELKLQP
jgi:GNAT superfamily N-acetyltransferase